jgi:hypothetical protein
MGSQELPICFSADTKSPSSANFVGIVVGFLNVLLIRLRNLLLAASLSFECNFGIICLKRCFARGKTFEDIIQIYRNHIAC